MMEIVDSLADAGLAVADGFVAPETAAGLMAEFLSLREDGLFRRAEVGRGGERQLADDVRRDEILWLSPDDETQGAARRHLWARFTALKESLNEALYLGLKSFEGHFALYPPGAYYARHSDRFKRSESRVISAVLYLNPAWDMADGGQLRVYAERPVDIYPSPGRLVLFTSDRFEHEVLPTKRERYSFTGWFHRGLAPIAFP